MSVQQYFGLFKAILAVLGLVFTVYVHHNAAEDKEYEDGTRFLWWCRKHHACQNGFTVIIVTWIVDMFLINYIEEVSAAYNASESAYSQGYEEGYDSGYEDGSEDEYDIGVDDGYEKGYSAGYDDGRAAVDLTVPYDYGYEDGYNDAINGY